MARRKEEGGKKRRKREEKDGNILKISLLQMLKALRKVLLGFRNIHAVLPVRSYRKIPLWFNVKLSKFTNKQRKQYLR